MQITFFVYCCFPKSRIFTFKYLFNIFINNYLNRLRWFINFLFLLDFDSFKIGYNRNIFPRDFDFRFRKEDLLWFNSYFFGLFLSYRRVTIFFWVIYSSIRTIIFKIIIYNLVFVTLGFIINFLAFSFISATTFCFGRSRICVFFGFIESIIWIKTLFFDYFLHFWFWVYINYEKWLIIRIISLNNQNELLFSEWTWSCFCNSIEYKCFDFYKHDLQNIIFQR